MDREQQIAKLRQICSSENATAGPLDKGLAASDYLVISTFNSRAVAEKFQQRLWRDQIGSVLNASRDGYAVSVELEDRERANAILDHFTSEVLDPRIGYRVSRFDTVPLKSNPALVPSRRFDYALFGFIGGFTVGGVLLADVRHWKLSLIAALAIGVATGLVGFSAQSLSLLSRWQWSVGLLLTLTTTIAIVIFLLQQLL